MSRRRTAPINPRGFGTARTSGSVGQLPSLTDILGSLFPPGTTTTPAAQCSGDAQCLDGPNGSCFNGNCYYEPECAANADCAQGYSCEQATTGRGKTCVQQATVGCSSAADCMDGPEGDCFQGSCYYLPQCETSSDCAPGSACVPADRGVGNTCKDVGGGDWYQTQPSAPPSQKGPSYAGAAVGAVIGAGVGVGVAALAKAGGVVGVVAGVGLGIVGLIVGSKG